MRPVHTLSVMLSALMLQGLSSLYASSFLSVEAESATLGLDWNTTTVDGFTGITITSDSSGSAPGSSARVATYSLTFPSSGTYELYARIRVGSGTYTDDSMFFAKRFGVNSPTNNADWTTANGLAGAGYTTPTDVVANGGSAGSQVWKWINLTQLTGTSRLSVPTDGLVQSFEIGAREDGLIIDRLVFGKIGYPFTVADLDNGTTPDLEIPIDSSRIDGARIHQRIDGFGAGAVFLYSGLDPLPDSQMDQLFGTNSGQFGLSLLRIRISPSGNNAANLLDAQKAVARGAKVMASPWTPPASMKDNNNLVGGSLKTNEYANYAAYLNDFAGYMRENGVELAAVSMQNEPDIEVSYESCDWTPEQIRTFCRNHAGAITNAPFMAAESFSFNKTVYDPSLNDPDALKNIDVLGGHLYGTTVSDYPNARAKDRPMWMTEYLINDQSWETAMQTAEQLHDSLVTGNMSAYIWWKTIGDINGLLDNAGTPQKRGYMMGQFSRFVRPDDYRVGVTGAGAAKVSAYKNAAGKLSIVAVNHSGTEVSQTFILPNCTVNATMTPWITSSNLSLAAQSPVAVNDDTFSYVLPAMSVVTFTGQLDDTGLNRFISIATPANNEVNINYSASPGLNYVLESATDLPVPVWISTATNTADQTGIVDFFDEPTGSNRFYRARSDSTSAHPVYP